VSAVSHEWRWLTRVKQLDTRSIAMATDVDVRTDPPVPCSAPRYPHGAYASVWPRSRSVSSQP